MHTLFEGQGDGLRVPRWASVDQPLFEQDQDRVFDGSWPDVGRGGLPRLRKAPWRDIAKALGREVPPYADEAHIRSFGTEGNVRPAQVPEAAE